jgi:hypothetical protein
MQPPAAAMAMHPASFLTMLPTPDANMLQLSLQSLCKFMHYLNWFHLLTTSHQQHSYAHAHFQHMEETHITLSCHVSLQEPKQIRKPEELVL